MEAKPEETREGERWHGVGEKRRYVLQGFALQSAGEAHGPGCSGGERRRAELQPGEWAAGAKGEEDSGEKRRNQRDVRGAGGEADRARAGAQPLLLERHTRCEEKQGPETVVVKTFS